MYKTSKSHYMLFYIIFHTLEFIITDQSDAEYLDKESEYYWDHGTMQWKSLGALNDHVKGQSLNKQLDMIWAKTKPFIELNIYIWSY